MARSIRRPGDVARSESGENNFAVPAGGRVSVFSGRAYDRDGVAAAPIDAIT